MFYHSTRSDCAAVDSAQAVLEGLAPDGGLYMPDSIPDFDWKSCLQGSSMDMSTRILSSLLPDIPHMEELVKKAYTGKFETDHLVLQVLQSAAHLVEGCLFAGIALVRWFAGSLNLLFGL